MSALLDIRTLVLIYVGVTIGQAAVLVYLWRERLWLSWPLALGVSGAALLGGSSHDG